MKINFGSLIFRRLDMIPNSNLIELNNQFERKPIVEFIKTKCIQYLNTKNTKNGARLSDIQPYTLQSKGGDINRSFS